MVVPVQGIARIRGRDDRRLTQNRGIKASILMFLLIILSILALTVWWIDIALKCNQETTNVHHAMTLRENSQNEHHSSEKYLESILRLFGSQSQKSFANSSLGFPLAQKHCPVKCPATRPSSHMAEDSHVEACPGYFRWIHEDLRPWRVAGITRETVERAAKLADLRIVIIKGRVYVQKFKKVYQTRDVITVWGILQLLTMYPGKLPDLDFMFGCNDHPLVKKKDYAAAAAGRGGSDAASVLPPPLLHYCGDASSFDIVFPDWSFWGWPELNIRPWEFLKVDLGQGNKDIKWLDREPYAYWKGNSKLGQARKDLLTCNVSVDQDWNARIYHLEWMHEKKHGFKTSELAKQCDHRYKIYVEGMAWSVSEKYILACDSMTLILDPKYHDFFTRSLVPMVHYWPINVRDKCNSIKFAVQWGNKNADKAQEIGKAGSKFVQEELRMKFIYDYMFHLLSEYGKLLKYQPAIPEDAVEVCSENMLCGVKGARKRFRIHSMVNTTANEGACKMPPQFDDKSLREFVERKEELTKQVENMRLSTSLDTN